MRQTFPIVMTLCFLFLGNLNATTYYLDFTNGNNGNDGLTPATAWKDISEIKSNNPMPGDTFLLKYGETWQLTSQFYIDYSGIAGDPIVYAAYGNPASGKPIITSVTAISGATNPMNWMETFSGSNVWALPLGATPGRLYLDQNEALRASTLADVGQMDNTGALGHWFYDSNTNLLLLYATQNPANNYSLFEGSSLALTTAAFNASHLVFEDLDFRGGTGTSIKFFGCTDILIQNCQLGHSGATGIELSNTFLDNTEIPCTNIILRDNFFNSDFTFFYGLGSERGVGDGVRMIFGVNNCEVYNNTFLNWAHNAIELRGDQAGGSGVNNNRIYDNHISAPDIPYAHPLGVDGFYGKCQYNKIFRNYVENCRTVSQINGNNNHIHHNIIRGMRDSPSKTTPTAFGFALSVYGTGLVSQDNLFEHNLIIDTDEAGFQVRGFGFPIQVMNNTIRNNILYNTGQAPKNAAYTVGTGIVIFDTEFDGVGPNTYQNNLLYNDNQAALIYFEDNDNYLSPEQFNDQNGSMGNTISNNIEADPEFDDFEEEDYRPAFGSPAIDAGITTNLTLDYALNNRTQGSAPDIGPFETNYLAEELPMTSRYQLLLLALVLVSIALGHMLRKSI